jgi:ATP-dependent Lon protease
LHVPMGATPKDGPSAGVSLFAALTSAVLNKPVAANLAMTGEITTLGEVCAIGGVREKLTACKNHNVTRVILPLANKKDVTKLPEEFKKDLTIYFITRVDQLYEICFPSEDTANDTEALHKLLTEQGVQISEFEKDDFHEVVVKGEVIQETNQIEQLF